MRGGQGTALRKTGRAPGGRQARQRVQQGPEVVAGVVAAGVDEVARRDPVPLAPRVERRPLGVADLGALHGERGEGISPGQRDDPQAGRADPQESRRGPRHGGAPHDHRIRVAEQLGPEALAEARRGRALVLLGELPGGQVQERGDDGEAGPDRQGAADGVGHGAGAPGLVGGAAPGAERGAANQERVERERTRTEQARDG